MSSKKRKLKEKDERREQYNQAAEAFRQGLFPSVTACAGHFGVNHKTLMNCIKSEREFVGCGRKSSTFTTEEESRLVKFVSDRLSLGCGIDFSQLCTVIQELANTHQAPDLHQARPPSAFQLCLRLPAPQFLSPLKSRQTSGSGRTACLLKDRSLEISASNAGARASSWFILRSFLQREKGSR